jgi:hypothetical protein
MTQQNVAQAMQAHINESDDDPSLVVAWVAIAGTVTAAGSRGAYLLTSPSANWEVRGLLTEALRALDR